MNLYDPPNKQSLIRVSISSSNEEIINIAAGFEQEAAKYVRVRVKVTG